MTTKTQKTTPAAAETDIAAIGARVAMARGTVNELGGAVAESGKAYVNGIVALGRKLGCFGRESLNEAGDHLRATFKARNLRELGELQAAYAQHRIEISATHAKELIDDAREKSEDVITPLTGLIAKAA